jgi:cation diffusion facilitator family transporter
MPGHKVRTNHLSNLTHDHVFDTGSGAAERGTRIVMWITLVTMAIEIAAGWWFNSMALLADGWHMSSHALAIGLSAFAYAAARRYARDPRFAFGTWKIEVLAGYTSAVFLVGIAALMAAGSIERLLAPQPVQYQQAMIVAGVGLAVNVVCAFILGGAHHHHHDSGHAHGDHDHHHHDLNLKSAYLHVITDAATSLLAIVALAGGWLYGWGWLDPAMGIVGAVLVAVWAKNLLAETGKVLLDREMDHPVVAEIREAVESTEKDGDTRIADLHVWRVGRQSYSCALSVVTRNQALTPQALRDKLAVHEEIVHVTVEIHHCR